MNEGWLCPKCGSAHGPQVATCPAHSAAAHMHCPQCGKRTDRLSIPRMGMYEFGDFCMCAVANRCQQAT